MKVALIGPEIEESLSLRYLSSALTRAGHEAKVIAYNRSGEAAQVASQAVAVRPELIGFSLVAQRRFEDFQTLAAGIRARGFRGHITAGGHFASLRAAEILRDTSDIDSILHHDGEERICGLADALPFAGDPPDGIDGITWRDVDGTIRHRPPARVPDVDSLARPSRRVADRTLGFARAPMVTSRGCAGACSFCSIHAWHRQVSSARLRFRSPAGVVEEMVALHRDAGVRVFVFHDDDFIHPRQAEALRRCRAILEKAEQGIGRPFAFVVKCRPDDVEPELFAYLKAKGLVRAYVGIESSSAAGVRTLNRRTTPERNAQALSTLCSLGVYSCFNLLLFHPETTLEELDENLRFLSDHVEFPFDVARTELYARSALEERMIAEGRALGDYRGYDYRLPDARAEAVFQMFADVLWDRHFGGDSILRRAQELGFRASLLRRLAPEAASAELESRIRKLIREVNEDTIRYLRLFIDRAATGAATNAVTNAAAGAARNAAKNAATSGGSQYTETMRAEVASRVRAQAARWFTLNLELEVRASLGRGPLSRATGAIRPLLAQGPRTLGRMAASIPLAASIVGTFACGVDDTSHVCDPPPSPIRYQRDIEPRLNAQCALPECHSGSAPAESLDLETGRGYDELVGVPSREAPKMKRVSDEWSAPDSSYLVHKLDGTQVEVGGSGERMPKGSPPATGLLDSVKAWIRYGISE